MVATTTPSEIPAPEVQRVLSHFCTPCQDGGAGGQEVKQVAPLEPIARAFRDWLDEQHYSAKTVKVYVDYMRRALAVLGSLDKATGEQLLDWVRTLPRSAASRNQARKALLAYYRHLGRRPNPAQEIPTAPRRRGLPRPLSGTQHDQMLAAAPDLETRVMIQLFLTTGCRFSELRLARWDEIDLDPGLWRVQGKGSGRAGPKERMIPLHAWVVPTLREWRGEAKGRWLFPSSVNPGQPMSESTFRRRFSTLSDLAGLPGVTPHRCRHTVATNALAVSGDISAVGELLGHVDYSTTKVYAGVLPERLRALVDSLPVG